MNKITITELLPTDNNIYSYDDDSKTFTLKDENTYFEILLSETDNVNFNLAVSKYGGIINVRNHCDIAISDNVLVTFAIGNKLNGHNSNRIIGMNNNEIHTEDNNIIILNNNNEITVNNYNYIKANNDNNIKGNIGNSIISYMLNTIDAVDSNNISASNGSNIMVSNNNNLLLISDENSGDDIIRFEGLANTILVNKSNNSSIKVGRNSLIDNYGIHCNIEAKEDLRFINNLNQKVYNFDIDDNGLNVDGVNITIDTDGNETIEYLYYIVINGNSYLVNKDIIDEIMGL